MEAALTAIFSGQKPQSSLEELYRTVENICRQNRGEKLFLMLDPKCRAYINNTLLPSLQSKSKAGASSIEALHAVLGAWTKWNEQLVSECELFFQT
jgi:hypothetical protein